MYSTKPTREILDKLGCPDLKLKIIHIAGTNGKGSTAEFFTQILIAAGKKVGTFTSPAVYDFNSQFKVNGKPLENIQKYFNKAYADGASEFEIQTAGTILAFAEEGCEWAVIECGMGGLTDATNAILKKELAVITSVSLEHTEYLGKTIEEICRQKAGIIKDCPVIVNSKQTEEARRYFKSIGATFADKELCGYELGIHGSLQPYNAATAIAGARLLGIDEGAIRVGLKNAKPEGRLQVFNAGATRYVLDGAHNPAAFEQLYDMLKGTENLTIIFGCLSDKDIDGNLKGISSLTQKIIAVPCPSPRARELGETVSACRKYFKDVQSAQSVTEALETAHAKTVAVCGSFTLLEEAKRWIEKRQ